MHQEETYEDGVKYRTDIKSFIERLESHGYTVMGRLSTTELSREKEIHIRIKVD